MAIELNHIIIWCRDNQRSARFLADMLGRPAPRRIFHFMVVDLDNHVSLDFMAKAGEIAPQHYAFMLDRDAFDAAYLRLQRSGAPYWSDPARSNSGELYRHDGMTGAYFDDPDDHLFEIITRS